MKFCSKWAAHALLVLAMTFLIGCAGKLPTPNPPQGKGWATRAQGYKMQTATSSSSTYGNTTVTSTSSSTTMHATENKKVTAENVEKTLTAGRPVASFPMNEEVFARYDIEKGSSPEALVENAPETPMVAEQPTKEEPEEKDLKAEADQTPKTEKEETKLEEQSI